MDYYDHLSVSSRMRLISLCEVYPEGLSLYSLTMNGISLISFLLFSYISSSMCLLTGCTMM